MDQIVSRGMMFDRGADAFNAGRTRDSHNMNPWSAGVADWLAGFDDAKRVWKLATRHQAVVVTTDAPLLELEH